MIKILGGRLNEELSRVSYKPISHPLKRDILISFLLPRLRESTLVIVLGMHRSGTSLLTSLLDQAGVDTGHNHIAARADNPKGFWEDRFFYSVNRDLLTACGANRDGFDDPNILKSVGSNCASLVNRRNLSAVHVYCHFNFISKVWGWKDPRTCITFPYWQCIFGELGIKDIRLVVAFRSPFEVARSLIKRGTDEFFLKAGDRKFEQAISCWVTYNELCLQYSELFPSFFIDHKSLSTPEDLKGSIMACAHFLNLKRKASFDPISIFDPDLVSQHAPEDKDKKAASDLYDILKKKSFESYRCYSESEF